MPDQPHRGWFLEKLRSTLAFGDRTAFLLEEWSIRADVPLKEVLVDLNLDPEWLTDPRDPSADPVRLIDVLGAEIIPGLRPASRTGRRSVALRLPGQLGSRQTHDFQLRVPVPQADRIGHHLCRPVVRCRRLDVRVHFDRTAVPNRVRAVVGDHPGVPGPRPRAEVPVNLVGEVEMSFERTVLGRPYGLEWSRP